MNKAAVETYARRLKSRLPVIGAALRRCACRRLAGEGTAVCVPHLVGALGSDDARVRELAQTGLRSLKAQESVDALCAAWAQGRDKGLRRIVADCGYVAAKPVQVRVLSALVTGRAEIAGESAACVAVLLQALGDRDEQVASRAETALRSLKVQEAVDALCAAWAESRDGRLAQILVSVGYVASRPLHLRVLSGLKTGKLGRPANGPAVHALLRVLGDADEQIASRADSALRSLASQDVVDALCEAAIAEPAGPAAQIVKDVDYQPQAVSRRCVLFLVTGQIDRYVDLDFEGQYARAEYQAADEGLKHRIAEVVRQSGDTRLLPILQEARPRRGGIDKRARELTQEEASIVLEVYGRQGQWAEVFSLLLHIPLASVINGVDLLAGSSWRPQSPEDAALLEELLALRAQIGEMPDPPPTPQALPGRVFDRWIAEGRSEATLLKPAEELRHNLREGPPPVAVAALAGLCARGGATLEDIETARAHPHALVRVGYLALCGMSPELAFSDSPLVGGGGDAWMAQLSAYLHDAAPGRQRARNLTLDQLDVLNQALSGRGAADTGRAACARVLCALGAHRLRDTI